MSMRKRVNLITWGVPILIVGSLILVAAENLETKGNLSGMLSAVSDTQVSQTTGTAPAIR